MRFRDSPRCLDVLRRTSCRHTGVFATQLLCGFVVVLVLGGASVIVADDQAARQLNAGDTSAIKDVVAPPLMSGEPAAGKRVAVTAREYRGTKVHHAVYLPADWTTKKMGRGETWPVIVEYTGNHFPASGSTGEISGASLGYGISRGEFIWITLPFVSEGGQSNAVTWWGDERATVEYAKTNVPRICEQFGGDPKKVLICGFSRGAIAVNYIGLHDDAIAKLWCGFITHDHYDGVREWHGTPWGSPLDQYRTSATTRLKRLNGRPQLICQSKSTRATSDYLQGRTSLKSFTFLPVDTAAILGKFPNKTEIHPHTDRWLTKASNERNVVWSWVDSVVDSNLSHD